MNIGSLNHNMYLPSSCDDLMYTPINFGNTGMMTNPINSGLGNFGSLLSPKYQMKWLKDWDTFGVDRQVMSVTNNNNARFKMAGQNGPIMRQIQVLHNEICENNQDNIKREYDKLVNAVRNSYASQLNKNLSSEEQEMQIRAFADSLYAQQTGGYIEDNIKRHSESSFVTGLKHILCLKKAQKTTADENISYITGAELTRSATNAKKAGTYLGYAGAAAGGGLLGYAGIKGLCAVVKDLHFNGKLLGKIVGPVLGAIGTLVCVL